MRNSVYLDETLISDILERNFCTVRQHSAVLLKSGECFQDLLEMTSFFKSVECISGM